jgi:TolC family type I secretion outer membrane protein
MSSARADPMAPVSSVPQDQQHIPAFEEMLASVYRDNPQLKAERETLRTLDEHVSQASGAFRPTASINAEYGYAGVSDANEAWRYGDDRNLGLTITQPIYNAATNGQWHASKDRVYAGRAALTAAEQKVLMAAITAWMDVYEKGGLLALNGDNSGLTQSYFNATKQRYDAGDGTQTDLAVAESRSASGEARRAMAQSAYDNALTAYERVTNMHGENVMLPPLPSNLPRSEAETLELAKKNPDLQQADYQVDAAEHDIDTADGARWPSVFLRGNVYDQTSPDLGLQSLRGDSITINASLPLYQGGVEYSKEREAKIARDKSRYDSVTILRNVTDEARQAWSHLAAAQTIVNDSDHAVDSCAHALSGIDQEQKIGTRTLTEVLDAQEQLLNARITALQARKEMHLSAYRLLAAVGRLTVEGLNLPTHIYNPVEHYDDVADRWFGTSVEPAESAMH